MPRLSESRCDTPDRASSLNAPNKNAGINKAFLTPCRRLGLSRQVKTPNNKNIIHSNTSPICTSYDFVTTPASCTNKILVPEYKNNFDNGLNNDSLHKSENNALATDNILLNPICESSPNNTFENKWESRHVLTPTSQNLRKPKNIKSKTVPRKNKSKSVSTPKFKSDTLKKSLVIENNTTINLPIENKTEVCDSTEDKCEILTSVSKCTKPGIPVSKNKTKPNLNEQVIKDITLTNPIVSSNSKEPLSNQSLKESQTLNIVRKSKFRSFTLSTKKSLEDEVSDHEDFSGTPTLDLSLESVDLGAEVIDNRDDNFIDKIRMQSIKKTNTKRSITYSSDEDFVPSPSSNKCEEDYERQINEIKLSIKDREKHLDKLNQTIIYKRIHDVTELKNLTDTWKKGCQEGLTYLLKKLNEHSELDMPLLMKRLNIPNTVVYNEETDAFI